MSADRGPPPLVFIFDHVRLRSHLFFRFLSTSPNAQPIYHPYLFPAVFGPERYAQHLHRGEMEQEGEDEAFRNSPFEGNTYAHATQRLVKAVADAQSDGKIPLVNEHWPCVLKLDIMLGLVRGQISNPSAFGTNPTYIPDDLFNSLRPIILIRHPINAVDSIYRDCLKFSKLQPGDERFGLLTTNKPLRVLFDYFQSRAGLEPIVVDGDDILWRTDAVSKSLCGSLGLGKLSDTWSPTSQEEIEAMHPWLYKLTQHIHESRGIERPVEGRRQPSMHTAVQEWTEKYGQAIAEQLQALATKNMPHYEFLQQFSI